MSRQMWKPVEEDYWGYMNVERKGMVLSICTDAEFEKDNGYLIVPLPDSVRLCQLIPADAPDALTVRMTPERIEALENILHIVKVWMSGELVFNPNAESHKYRDATGVLRAMLTELKGATNDTPTR